ncbi:glycoside hydrolase family 55 protein [Haladaptatus salinisoli]|uniref:glycoside hydrolase family 55 protein n=1 Tax=Haladaptatus salinisoli TaxID=2884876 RepID=UPI001D0A298A|nr:glycoside hydrolase family 55 protein [Haladaptatus salinisoli]
MTIDITEKGADPNGNEPIDDVLEDAMSDGATVEFPPGTYRVERIETDHDDLELVGTNATLVPTNRQECTNLIDATGDGFVFDGFELDFREVAYPPRIDVQADDWRFSNVVVRGHCGTNGKDMDVHGVSFMRPLVESEGATGTIRDVYLHEGSGPPGERSNRRAFLVKNDHCGHLVLDRVWLEQWGENTFYGNNVQGKTTIKNSFFRNTNVGLRVGGDTDIENCTFVKDGKLPKQGWSGSMLMRGVHVEGDDEDAYPGRVTVDNCDFSFTHRHESTDAPVVAHAPTQEICVSNCRIRYDGNRSSPVEIHCKERLEKLTLKNVDIENNSEDRPAVGLYGKPKRFGTVSGVVGGENAKKRDGRVYENLELGTPNPPNSEPPLPKPPEVGATPNGRGGERSERESAKKRGGEGRNGGRRRTTPHGEEDRRTKGDSGDGLPLVDDALAVVGAAAGRIRSAIRSAFG